MKVLFVSLEHSEQGSGGKVITQRNKEFVEKYFGVENVFSIKTYLKNEIMNHSVEKAAESRGVDAVFLDASFFGPFSRAFYNQNLVFTFFHNVESNYSDQEKKQELKQRFVNYLTNRIEECNCKNSFRTITLNQRDSLELNRIYGRSADFILSSSMKDGYKGAEYQAGDYLLFVGSDFFGNTDGLFPFIENCMEHINCNLKVVGNGMEKYAGRYDKKYKTEFIGFVDDLASVYANAKAVVMPIISGSGMKTKTCEALMYAKVIFGTDEAFEGYDIANSDCCLCNSDREFIDSINNFLKQDGEYFSKKNRQLFLEKYDSSVAYESFKTFMDDSIGHMLPDRFSDPRDRDVKIIQEGSFNHVPDVSVIMPVYNTAGYLSDSLGSIMNQSLNNIQIILVDDGSTDDSLSVLQEYAAGDNRITLISQRNSAQGAARNLGLKYAVGRYVYFMDSDDSLELSALEELLAVAERDEADIVMLGGTELWNFKNDYPGVWNGQKLFLELGRKHESLSCPCIFFTKRDIAINSIEFPENCYAEDLLISYQLLMAAKRVVVIHRDYYHVNLRGDSTTRARMGICNAIGFINSIIYYDREIQSIEEEDLQMETFFARNMRLKNLIIYASDFSEYERQVIKNYLNNDGLNIWETEVVPHLDGGILNSSKIGKTITSVRACGWGFTRKLILRNIKHAIKRI